MTTPWQTITDAEIRDLSHRGLSPWTFHLIRKVEEVLRERNTPITPEFLAGWHAAFNAVLEEMQYTPPSKVGEARFTARLVLLKSQHGGNSYGGLSNIPDAIPKTSHSYPDRKGE